MKGLKIRIYNRLLVAFDKGWICLGAGAKTEASQQTATLANMTESGYDRNTYTKNSNQINSSCNKKSRDETLPKFRAS